MKIFVTAFLLSITSIFSQAIEFEFDYAQFAFDTTSNYVEFYYSFDQSSLTLAETDSTMFVKCILNVLIKDANSGDEIVNRNWAVNNLITDSTQMHKNLLSAIGFILAEGSYECSFTGRDEMVSNSSKTISENIEIKPFLKLSTSISDLQLATNILQDSQNKNSVFFKNSFEVIPSPNAIFGENQPVLFYYSELYNIKNNSGSEEFRLDQLVFNSKGNLVNSKSKKINKKIDSRVEVGTVLVNKFPTDTYTLMINLIDSVGNYGVSSSKKFFVYNPSIAYVDTFGQQTTSTLGTMFGVMSEEELDDLFSKSKYLAAPNEIKQYDKLSNEEGKREFLHKFWEARDDDLNDGRNQFFLNYLKRIDQSTTRFSALNKAGWKTDRGRIFLMYGEPSEIERYPNQTETRPYEIWNYNDIEGGVFFIFADLTGFTDYQLVNSNKRGELRDDYWERRIMVR